MVTYNQLRKEFDKKVLDLQSNCKHKHLSAWSEEWWAFGHSTGNMVRMCKDCNKRVRERKAVVK